jgi:hypothetical protein
MVSSKRAVHRILLDLLDRYGTLPQILIEPEKRILLKRDDCPIVVKPWTIC